MNNPVPSYPRFQAFRHPHLSSKRDWATNESLSKAIMENLSKEENSDMRYGQFLLNVLYRNGFSEEDLYNVETWALLVMVEHYPSRVFLEN